MVGGGVKPKLTKKEDSHAFLKVVEETFQVEREKYIDFMKLMNDFKARRTDIFNLVEKVKELFKGHPDLIFSFNAFLPKGYEIILPLEREPPTQGIPPGFGAAIAFVNKIKARFQDDVGDGRYKKFLDMVNEYRRQVRSIPQLLEGVVKLFQGHRDLISEFLDFLPTVSPGTSHHRAQDPDGSQVNANEDEHDDSHTERKDDRDRTDNEQHNRNSEQEQDRRDRNSDQANDPSQEKANEEVNDGEDRRD